MSIHSLRVQILKELTESVEKKRKAIKELDEKASSEMFLRSTVTGGAFSTAARNACDSRAAAAQQKASLIRSQNAWGEEMLKKYKK